MGQGAEDLEDWEARQQRGGTWDNPIPQDIFDDRKKLEAAFQAVLRAEHALRDTKRLDWIETSYRLRIAIESDLWPAKETDPR